MNHRNSHFSLLSQLSETPQPDCASCGQGTAGNSLCGLLMLDGNLGRKNWRVPMRECAVGLQCDLVSYCGDLSSDKTE